MPKTEYRLQYEEVPQGKGEIPVITVAAGASSRMCGTNKQLLPLCGIPAVIRTLMRLEACEKISNIILVTRAEDIFVLQQLAEKYSLSKLTDIVCGGETRRQSVENGLARLPQNAERVLIHDGARPFVTEKIVNEVIGALEKHCAVACAVKPKDTVKQINAEGYVVSTPDREALASVQTPQGVWVREYRAALQSVENSPTLTDDMSVMEAAGYTPFIVQGSYDNIKITTPEDIPLAEYLILKESEA